MNNFKIFPVVCIAIIGFLNFGCDLLPTGSLKEDTTTEYKITYETNGGSSVPQLKVKVGDTIVKPTDPTKADYTFLGWFRESTLETVWNFDTDQITQDLTLYAKWVKTATLFTVIFESNGGSAVAQASVESKGKVIKPTDPTKADNTFQGWYKESTFITSWDFTTDTVSQNITLYAKWVSVKLFLYFDPNGGTGSIDSIQFNPGETKQLDLMDSQITRTGYKFISWNTVPDRTGGTEYRREDNVKLTDSSLTLYAQWVKLYNLGDPGPAGGLVFYGKNLDNTWSYPDWVYMEAAPAGWYGTSEDPNFYFGVYRLEENSEGVTVGTETEIGNGKTNTEALVSAMGTAAYQLNNPSNKTKIEEYAARSCDLYESRGYDDWFLPSKDELNQMYQNLQVHNLGGFSNSNYWSSSEASYFYVWHQIFSNGTQGTIGKPEWYKIRPVRAF